MTGENFNDTKNVPSPTSIGVLGAGTWGMALARMLTNLGHEVMVWSALPEEIERLRATRRQVNLPDMVIPDATGFTTRIEEACLDRDVLLFAVPSVYVRATARAAAPFIRDGQIIVDVAKGMEQDTLLTMTQVIRSELDAHGEHHNALVALSGPTHAEEVAKDLPTTIVSACPDIQVARLLLVMDIYLAGLGLLKIPLNFLIESSVLAYRRLAFVRFAEHERPVSFCYKVILEERDAVCQRLLILCDQHQTSGIHIDPVAELCFLEPGVFPDLVDQGVIDVALARMDRDALEFIDDEKSLGLGDDLIHLLRSFGRSFFRDLEKLIRKPYLYCASCLYRNVLIDLFAVDPYVAPFKGVEKIRGLKLRECL